MISHPKYAYASERRLTLVAAGFALTAKGSLPSWIRNIEAGTEVERAFFRMMSLPYGDVLFRRPPAETRPALGELIQQKPADAELYSLRALEDEQQLDFAAAESDWKLYAEKSADKARRATCPRGFLPSPVAAAG